MSTTTNILLVFIFLKKINTYFKSKNVKIHHKDKGNLTFPLLSKSNLFHFLRVITGEPKGTWKESWRAMEKAKRDGKIRSLGFSNIYHDQIYELLNWSTEPISVIQNWFDPLNQDQDTRRICDKYNIRFMGYSTLGEFSK